MTTMGKIEMIKKNRKGITLMELIITLGIILIVFQVIYSIFFMGNKSFKFSKNKGFAQQGVRSASDFVNRELRNVKEVSKEKLEGKHYSLSLKDGKLVKRFHDGSSTEEILSLADNLVEIKFSHVERDLLGYIKVTIISKEGQNEKDIQGYSLKFDVLLENLPDYDEDIDQDIIYYSKYE